MNYYTIRQIALKELENILQHTEECRYSSVILLLTKKYPIGENTLKKHLKLLETDGKVSFNENENVISWNKNGKA